MFRSADTAMFTAESRFITIPDLLYVSRVEKDEWAITRRVSHVHEHAEIGFIRSGSAVFIIDEEEYLVSKGDFYIYNKGTIHDEQPEKYTLSVYCAGISRLALPQLPPDCILPSDTSPVVHCAEYFDLLEQLFSYLYESLAHQTAGSRETASHMLMTILSLIFQKTEHSAKRPPVRPHPHDELCINVKTFIHEHYLDDISLQTISNAVCISPYYMSRVFKKETGFSPMEYVERLRLGQAQVLLIHTDIQIIEIAHQTGYNNLSTFNYAFSKLFGMSPKKFKKVYRDL